MIHSSLGGPLLPSNGGKGLGIMPNTDSFLFGCNQLINSGNATNSVFLTRFSFHDW